RRDNDWLRQEVERQQAAAGAAQAAADKTVATMRETFQSLAAEALHTNRNAFFDLARTAVQPLSDTVKQVHDRLGVVEKERSASFAQLNEQLTALGTTTNTQSRALRTPSVRGRWGEMQLRRVVELAGMLHRCDFDEQPELPIEGGRQRPDLVVHLPGGKQIVVDAKAPLEAFLNAQDTADETARVELLRAHARQVRDHVEKLGSKAYWDSLEN